MTRSIDRAIAEADFLLDWIDLDIERVVRARVGYVARSAELNVRPQDMVFGISVLGLAEIERLHQLILELGADGAIAAELRRLNLSRQLAARGGRCDA